ncbi:hypothetical protein ACTXT7_004162 [Hymenolepis weldensis]
MDDNEALVSVVIVCRPTLPTHACAKFFALAIWSGRIPSGIYDPIMKSSQSGLCPIVFLLLLFVQCALQGPPPKGHPKINKTKSVEKALIRMLIARYQKFGVVGRPVSDNKQVLLVRYGLQLIQILELDENKQILHTNCWSMYKWNDTLLHWNPAEHGNITEVRIFPSQVWTPDIQLFNFVDERIQDHRIARVVVHADGSILWVPQALFKSACQVEITYFPYDTQASFYLLLKDLARDCNFSIITGAIFERK